MLLDIMPYFILYKEGGLTVNPSNPGDPLPKGGTSSSLEDGRGSKRGCKRKDKEGKKKRIRGEEEEKNNKTDLGQVKKR